MIFVLILFITVGIVGGFLSGLLGIGGGLVMVPLLTLAFSLLGVESDQVYRMAVGTSLASILFTSLSSARAHNKILPVRWDLVKKIAPWLVIGIFLGSSVATRINPLFLKSFFTLFIFALAVRMIFDPKIEPREKPLSNVLTGAVGMIIGVVSSMLGIAGGTMLVPYLTWNGKTMHCAIGVSVCLGVFISLSGATGYIINGFNQTGLPWGALGYVYIPALITIMITASLCAPFGVKLAHKLSAAQLKIAFACAMLIIGTGMISSLVKDYL